MSEKRETMQTPLARARGLGSAKSGLHHWWHQRLTAAAMVVLIAYAIWLVASLSGADYAAAVGLISQPWHASMLLLLVLTGFYHAALGLQVVIEDYIGNEKARMFTILLVKAGLMVLAVMAVFSTLRIAL
ncbi:MAG: succinate dehydrogenase, hydrophobic membrane anchor protein [Candidatus Puniceispirillaceae bacterium]